MSSRRAVALLALVGVLLAGCGRSVESAGEPPPLRPAWQPSTLPAPPGPSGRLLVRDAAACADRWYVVGGVAGAAGETRPAAWTSADGTSWTSMRLRPTSYYGAQNVLYSVACRQGEVALLGARNGGAHGNPRTSSWRLSADGALAEVAAPFELFGGPRAVSVARIVAGPSGWLIVGSRKGGASVWSSVDAGRFTLGEGVPELASDGRGRTAAYDAVGGASAGWLVTGSLLVTGGTALAPVAWTSDDGVGWRRWLLPGAAEGGQAQRVARVGGEVVAAGSRGRGFGAWRWDGRGWRAGGSFGRAASGGGVASVAGLVAVGGRAVAVVRDGVACGLWLTADAGGSWRPVALPASVPDGGDTAVAVAGGGDRVVLAVDDGRSSGIWWARLPAVDR